MADREHLNILNKGVSAWNKWKTENAKLKPNLTGADLTGLDLKRINLVYTNLSGAKISGANLADSDLRGASFRYACLTNANLCEADLIGTKFSHADLDHADFSRTKVGWSTFGDNDLSFVIGLDAVLHSGPSVIGINTVLRSKGRIPISFLRGAGVPEEFVLPVLSLIDAGHITQLNSCFISYSHKDEEFAKRLHSRLCEANIRVWFTPEDIRGGKKLYDQIEQAIQIHDRLLLVLSENSMRSDWVITEVRNARKIEIEEKRRKLFPIRLVDFDALRTWQCVDAQRGKDLAVEVLEYFIPDFSNWKNHDAFESAFKKLLRDLKAEETKPRRV